MKELRPSVIRSGEWFKNRDQEAWKRTRLQVLNRDNYTCVYCTLTCRKFMQVNHIGAEDNHDPDNLETVCAACHSVLHMGINAANGLLTVFDCKPEVTNMAQIICVTRAMVAKDLPWPEIESTILRRFGQPEGQVYDTGRSVAFANDLLHAIQPPDFRGYLAPGLAVMFHEAEAWQGYPEKVWKWQCQGSRYASKAGK